jgi:alpha-tubulin suppressor-like RCC1 family protein
MAYQDAPPAVVLPVTTTSGTVAVAVAGIEYGSSTVGWLNATLSTSTTPTQLTLRPSTTVRGGGTGGGTLTVIVPGTYTARVMLTSTTAGVTNSPRAIDVTFSVSTLSPEAVVPLSVADATVALDTWPTSPFVSVPISIRNTGSNTAWLVRVDSIHYPPGLTVPLSCPANDQLNSGGLAPGSSGTASCQADLNGIGIPGTYSAVVWVSGVNTRPAPGLLSVAVHAVPALPTIVSVQLGASQLRAGDTTSCIIRITDSSGTVVDRNFAVTVSGTGDVLQQCGPSNTAVTRLIAATPGTVRLTATSAGASASASLDITPFGTPFMAATVSAGLNSTCAVTPDGVPYCWGRFAGASSNTDSPLQVPGNTVLSTIAENDSHTCGLRPDARAVCWGTNHSGELGNGTTTTGSTPTDVATTSTFAAIITGDVHTCALTSAGVAYCWGAWTGTTVPPSLVPAVVPGAVNFTAVAAGLVHTCGISSSGAAYCWGGNYAGELGDGTTTSRATPVAVPGDLTFRAIAAQDETSCGLTTAGATYCWGFIGNINSSSTTPRLVTSVPFESIAVGGLHACGLAADGSAYCWGFNSSGSLGDSTFIDRFVPAPVAGGHKFRSIAAGYAHTCGVATTGVLYCWGDGQFGANGDRVETQRSFPVPVTVP